MKTHPFFFCKMKAQFNQKYLKQKTLLKKEAFFLILKKSS